MFTPLRCNTLLVTVQHVQQQKAKIHNDISCVDRLKVVLEVLADFVYNMATGLAVLLCTSSNGSPCRYGEHAAEDAKC